MLCPCARHVMLHLVLVQPRKHPDMTENFDWDVKYQLESSRSTVAQCQCVRPVIKELLF